MKFEPSMSAVSLAALAAAAMLQPVQAAEPVADGRWRGSLTAAFSATSGNTRSASGLLKADGLRVTDADKITLGGAANYARSRAQGQQQQTTANKANLFGQYDWNFAPRYVLFGRLAFDRDELSYLSLRAAANAGVGWKWINTDTTQFTIYGGAGMTRERYSQAQTIRGSTGTSFERVNALFAEESQHQVSPTVRLRQRLEVTPSLGGDRNMLTRFTADMAVALNSTMSLNVGVINNYDSHPPAGLERNDLNVFTGLNVKFGGP